MAKVRPTNEMLKRLWLNGGSLMTPIWSVLSKALISHDEKWRLIAFFNISINKGQVNMVIDIQVIRQMTFCLLLLPLWESVTVLCFVVRYFMSSLVLQSS